MRYIILTSLLHHSVVYTQDRTPMLRLCKQFFKCSTWITCFLTKPIYPSYLSSHYSSTDSFLLWPNILGLGTGNTLNTFQEHECQGSWWNESQGPREWFSWSSELFWVGHPTPAYGHTSSDSQEVLNSNFFQSSQSALPAASRNCQNLLVWENDTVFWPLNQCLDSFWSLPPPG